MRRLISFICLSTLVLSIGALTPLDHAVASFASAGKSPSPRAGMGMIYDTKQGKVVLFGGGADCCNGHYLNETWTWDGTTWAKLSPPSSPPARTNIVLA